MAEFDDEIEYLEEDAEIVQQCVKTLLAPKIQLRKPPNLIIQQTLPKPVERKKRKKEEDDSDYDPTEDIQEQSEDIQKKNKKRIQQQKKNKTIHIPQPPAVVNPSVTKTVRYYHHFKEKYTSRKSLNIRIPDYDDPLCLPVRAIRVNESDRKRLTNWNNVCLEHFKYCNEILKPERGDTNKSIRTAVFKNVVNKITGVIETSIWSKTTVENTDGDKKSEIFQCVLPRYKEKRVLDNYILGNRKKVSPGYSSEAILSKENHKDGEALVVYKPKEAMSAVYGLIDKRQKEGEPSETTDDDTKMYLKELTCCRVCAPCFQGSCRGAKKPKKKALVCPICVRTYVSVYNLLSHLKTHSTGDVRTHRKVISTILADMVGYHYKCRICCQTYDSIKDLRQHTLKHQSTDIFRCEVGNHIVNKNK